MKKRKNKKDFIKLSKKEMKNPNIFNQFKGFYCLYLSDTLLLFKLTKNTLKKVIEEIKKDFKKNSSYDNIKQIEVSFIEPLKLFRVFGSIDYANKTLWGIQLYTYYLSQI